MDERIYTELGLKKEEYQRILEILGREPTLTELAMFSVEWSEHCGYTKSRKYLKLFPRDGRYPALVAEDAGGIVVDGLAIVFKMESHNHPSQVEPKQGAATGIGGIIRDIFTCGARPIACLDSLRFGELDEPYNRYLLKGIVEGIAFYGNCVGVPTVGGEIYFDNCYAGNCVVNAMCIGIAPKERLFRAQAKGPGNSIIYVGASTGRDGIGGCSILASNEFGEDEEKRPTVQIGDPFMEKCLIEATLEALETGHIVGMKDMGAAGLTCSTSEMAASGGVGIDIDLEKVPLREEGMEPWEIMMSESQERMLVCVEKGFEDEIINIFKKWDLNAVVIGKVTEEGFVRIHYHGETVAEIPSKALTEPPVYDMPAEEPEYIKEVRSFKINSIPGPKDYSTVLKRLISHPTIASKRWVWTQYDHMVQINTVTLPGNGVSVLRIKGTNKGIIVTTDCNPYYCYLDPYKGAQIAVAEACRNVVCHGGAPAGVTDCLNFGSPDKPDRYWQFKNAVQGIADACRAFNIPVVSGNVSFYNESPKGAVYPTPTIGLIGIIEDIDKKVDSSISSEGILLFLLGENKEELGGSQYLKIIHGKVTGKVPELDIELEKRIQEICLRLIHEQLIISAHDVSEGGLLVTALEKCISGSKSVGVTLFLRSRGIRKDALLFGETQSRIIVGVVKEKEEEVRRTLENMGIPFEYIGYTGGKSFKVVVDGEEIINLPIDELISLYEDGIPSKLDMYCS